MTEEIMIPRLQMIKFPSEGTLTVGPYTHLVEFSLFQALPSSASEAQALCQSSAVTIGRAD